MIPWYQNLKSLENIENLESLLYRSYAVSNNRITAYSARMQALLTVSGRTFFYQRSSRPIRAGMVNIYREHSRATRSATLQFE